MAVDFVKESPTVSQDPKDHVTRYHATYHAAPSHCRVEKKVFSLREYVMQGKSGLV
jgi:hypothetical protein